MKDFYLGKKVLVAGASGMTGWNLYEFLKNQGADVTGTCFEGQRYAAMGAMQEDAPVYLKVDFTDGQATREFFDRNEFDYVFICCARTYNAKVCKSNPECLILPNIQMTSNILENSLRKKVKKVLYISSATVYQPSGINLSEDDLYLNQNPYDIYMGIGWAKRYMEKLCEFYSGLGLSTVVVRPTNIYGKYDKTDLGKCHVIPALIMRGLNQENPYIIYSRGNGVKNFIHVSDFVRDLAKAMTCNKTFEVFNLCSDQTASIKEVVEVLKESLQYSPEITFQDNPDYVSYLNLSREKFDAEFGRGSYVDLKTGLKETFEWYSSLHQIQRKQTTT